MNAVAEKGHRRTRDFGEEGNVAPPHFGRNEVNDFKHDFVEIERLHLHFVFARESAEMPNRFAGPNVVAVDISENVSDFVQRRRVGFE